MVCLFLFYFIFLFFLWGRARRVKVLLTNSKNVLIGVYLEDIGHTLRGLFIIDDKQTLRQITMNDLVLQTSNDYDIFCLRFILSSKFHLFYPASRQIS